MSDDTPAFKSYAFRRHSGKVSSLRAFTEVSRNSKKHKLLNPHSLHPHLAPSNQDAAVRGTYALLRCSAALFHVLAQAREYAHALAANAQVIPQYGFAVT